MPRAALLSVSLLLAWPVSGQDGGGGAPTTPTPAPTLEGLLEEFARVPGLFARFREEKHMTLLAAPLVNEGTLHYAPPARVARHVSKPAVQTVLIDESVIKMGDASHAESVSLKGNPVLRQFLDSFLKVLAGDKKGLEAAYSLTFKPGKEGAWGLELRPKRSPMKDAIKSIAFEGRGLVMSTLTILEVGGDKSVTTFSEVDPARVYGAKEWAALFKMRARKKDPK